MNGSARSESVEMYLKSLAELGGTDAPVPIGRVAERLGVSPVSANEMMKRLGDQGLIVHEAYKGVTLTNHGRRLANGVIRRQRLWECFLVDHLQMDWARAYDLACDLEHATGPEVVDALAAYLNHPQQCPHGNPIPAADGELATEAVESLSDLKVGQSGIIRAIVPQSSELLAYVAQKGLRPGRRIAVVEAEPLDGPLTVRMDQDQEIIGLTLAELVLVEKVSDD